MATYNIDELINRYETERLTYKQTVGHCLQHIKMLTDQQQTAATSRTNLNRQLEKMNKQLNTLQVELKQLRSNN